MSNKWVVEQLIKDKWVTVSGDLGEELAYRIAQDYMLRTGDDGLGFRWRQLTDEERA